MSIVAQALTVTTAPTFIASGGPVGDKRTLILNNFSGAIFLGGADVDTTDGFPVSDTAPEGVALELGPGDDMYAIVATGTQTLNYIVTRGS